MTTEFAAEQREIWDKIAPYWDGHLPADDEHTIWRDVLDGLLQVGPGVRLLDVGCGNGRLARWASSRGASVVAVDGSSVFIDIARSRGGDVDYRVVDATDGSAVASLGAGEFDVAIAAMVLMNLASLEGVASGLARVLKPGGAFVFSVPHPCFPWAMAVDVRSAGAAGKLRVVNLVESVARLVPKALLLKVSSVVIPFLRSRKGYLSPAARKTTQPGQPVPHFNFHRPLHVLLRPFFDAGFALDAIREPAVGLIAGEQNPDAEIPSLLVGRLRLL